LEQRKAFIDKCKSNPKIPVSAIQTADTAPLSYWDPYSNPFPDPTTTPFKSEYLKQGLDKVYKTYEEAKAATVPVSTVQVRLDCSLGGRILVPALFKAPGGILIPATILVDTGSMANFVNKGFIRKHDLRTWQQKSPIRCVGFDGCKGVGGLVTQGWVGMIQLSSINSTPVPVPSSFDITPLGSVDAIFGLLWLDRQGWVALGSIKGRHHFSLGSTPLYVIILLVIGGEPKITVPPSNPPSPPPLALPLEFKQFADVFSPMANCVLPPHRDMDISINLKDGAIPPFGGLYNLLLDEQQQLKKYINNNLKKGFICLSSSSAAAPIFFVRVPGKKPRTCVDYRGLNAMAIHDSYPIPILGQLLNQLQGCRYFTKIDLKAAFNLLRVAKGHELKTALRTPWGLYEYLVLPFGLENAPTCFQQFIQHVLQEFLSVSF
jgi:hypothetical protein